MEYYEFLEKGFESLDLVVTDEGIIRVEDIVVDGDTDYDTDIDFDGNTGLLYEDDDGELQFISYEYVIGSQNEGF
jgi:hypothetical protein